MSEKFNYKSPLASCIREFVGLKTASGVSVLRTKWILLEIDKFYIDNGIRVATVTGEIVDKWRKTRVNDKANTLYDKYPVWNRLARFMCRMGMECYITPLPEYRNSRTGFTPYIFTREQMSNIMKKSGELRLHDRHMTYSINFMPTLVRLLYSTGIRISEALSLRNDDVNLNENYIIIRKSKNGNERIVPLEDTMKSVLLQYLSYQDRIPIAGMDLYTAMPILSTCLGHKSLSATEQIRETDDGGVSRTSNPVGTGKCFCISKSEEGGRL